MRQGEIIGLALWALIMTIPYLLALGIRWLRSKRKRKEVSTPQPAQSTEQAAEEATPTATQQAPVAAASAKPKQQPKKQLEVHEGRLMAAGFAKREYGYSSYRLEIQSTNLGVSHEIWGIDLKRALEASGAVIGDKIKVVLAGHLDVALNGETNAQKKIYDVTKLE